jgi:perosamine synthetase
MITLGESISVRLRMALGLPEGQVLLHEPIFKGNERAYLSECIDSTYVSSVGKFVDRFEAELSAFTGARRAIAVVNGTAALQISLRLVGVEQDDEVLVPSLTFVATANAPTYLGAIPHFCDSSYDTMGLDPLALRDWLKHVGERTHGSTRNRNTGRRIRAMVPVHIFGHSCDMDGLLALAHDYDLQLVEDAAESLGAYYNHRHLGTFGRVGSLSFNGNKIITTGGGGAILTDDDQLADHAKHLTTTAKVPHRWEYIHDEIGYNFRMPNLNAALGCAQLEQLPDFILSKRRLTDRYISAFSDLPKVSLMKEPLKCRSNYWLQTLILDEDISNQREEVLQATNKSGLMCRPAWRLLHRLRIFEKCPRAPLPVAESLAGRIINIPSSAGLA